MVCPLRYSKEQIERQNQEYLKWERDVERKATVIEEIGAYAGWDGAVLPEEYDQVARRVDAVKERFLSREARTPGQREQWEKMWPFQDGAH